MPLQERGGRGRAVDHHRTEREQAERGRDQDALLERLARARGALAPAVPAPSQGPSCPGRTGAPCRGCWHRELTSLRVTLTLQVFDQLAKSIATGFEVGELVEARTRRREQH